jgi:hypothetical protein
MCLCMRACLGVVYGKKTGDGEIVGGGGGNTARDTEVKTGFAYGKILVQTMYLVIK